MNCLLLFPLNIVFFVGSIFFWFVSMCFFLQFPLSVSAYVGSLFYVLQLIEHPIRMANCMILSSFVQGLPADFFVNIV